MKKTFGTFFIKSLLTSALVLTVVAFSNVGWSAVAERPQSTTAPKPDNSARGKMRANPGAATLQISDTVIDDSETTTSDTAAENDSESVEPIFVGNKANDFDSVLADLDAPGARDSAADARAEKIRQQREALNNQSNAQSHAISTGANACDTGLRKCMAEKCGADFTKCEKDNETTWENKLESCRSKTTCTAHEYTLLSPEIKADRDINVKMAFYESVLNCGNRYNKCITSNCGENFEKCISKSDGDAAIKKCDNIAKECKQQDNGMSQRVMNIFGTLRTEKTNAIKDDEKRLYELRDLMRKSCEKFGAMFDERTLDCVYTVNFFAGEDGTKMASKKLYAGDAFQCTPNWFGIDVTTFKENAYRLTRSESAASSAALGAGLGTAAGLYTSGALTRRIDEKGWNLGTGDKDNDGGTKDTKDNKSKSEDKCSETGGKWDDDKKTCECNSAQSLISTDSGNACKCKTGKWDSKSGKCIQNTKEKNKGNKPGDKDDKDAVKKCEKSGGSYMSSTNSCECHGSHMKPNPQDGQCVCMDGYTLKNKKCVENSTKPAKTEKEMCENPEEQGYYKGKWDPIKKECKCPKKGELSTTPLTPEKDTKWLKPELGGRPGESVDVISVLPGVNLNGTIQYSSGGCAVSSSKF
ncbi:MAG: hypothetical protein K6B71_02135 [Alphaproteobacteria bacterium]|nr:hypothetical protein [Alphaproteobacteria bacterium]